MSIGQLQAAENAPAFEQIQPDLELLEFLGAFATDEGEWIDPNILLEEEFSSLLSSVAAQPPGDDQQSDNFDNQDSAND